MMRKFLIFLLTAAAVSSLLTGCDNLLTEPPGQLYFPDYSEQQKLVGGNGGLMDFESILVQLGDRAILPLSLRNSGEGPLKITNLSITTMSVPSSNPADAAEPFSFVDGTFPALPLVIPAGMTVNDIFVEFAPETAGDFSGKLFIQTEDDSYYIDMIGTGLWQLTLNGSADGVLTILADDPADNVVIDGVLETGTATSSDGVFNILCEPAFLRQFEQWQASGASLAADMDFDNAKAVKTTVTLNTHAELEASILNPFVFVPDDYPDLQNAITYCAAHLNDATPATRKIAVIVRAGSHSVGNAAFTADVPVYGGYDSSWSSRAYKTVADRTNSTYKTTLNVSGTITLSGSGIKNNVVLEGFTINKSGTSNASLIKFDNSTTAELRYNTITGGGTDSAAAVEVTNSAAPLIKYNYVSGGSTTADYSESYGIKITEGGAPVIYRNSITGGTANGTGSSSYGIYGDFETVVYLRNNTATADDAYGISGGSAPDSGGKTYGVYIINNGNVLAEYNSIDGGSGKTAVGMYSKYGSYINAYHNNIFTSGGSTRIALWADQMGRIYHLTNSGVYNSGTALYMDPYDGKLTSIDAVNNKFNTDTNTGSAVDLSAAPSEVEYE